MGMNSLENLMECLEQGSNEIEVDAALGTQARRSLDRMMNFKAQT
jgi:quinolinate synthase